MDNYEFYDRVKRYAEKKGYSIPQLTEQVNRRLDKPIGKNAIYNWKTTTPNIQVVSMVASVLGVSVDDLLDNAATSNDLIDLHDLLESGTHMQFSGEELTEAQKERVKIILEQLFWETREKK